MPSESERFWSHVQKDESLAGGCWYWVAGRRGRMGYGAFRLAGARGKQVYAHRYAYESFCQPVPKGKVLDHLCRIPMCVNPAHLEVVTGRENILRGTSPVAEQAAMTACHRGHLLSGTNILNRSDGRRDCRLCRHLRYQEKKVANGIR